MLSTSQIDLELANKMRNMTPQEAAAAAAQAVAEAESAIAEAEEAARDAEAHEADAEAAKAFSDATKTLHGRSAPRMVRHPSISIIGSTLMASIVLLVSPSYLSFHCWWDMCSSLSLESLLVQCLEIIA